jgi:drug/metabolite transporter (DMT)-like permease
MSNFSVILIAFTGYSLLNLSQAVQKVGLLFDRQKFIKKWLIWFSGTLGTIISMGIVMVALAMGKVSIVSSMAGCGLIVLAVFSHFFLKERISILAIMGIILIILGSGLVGLLNKPSGESKINFLSIIIYPLIFSGIYLILWFFGHNSKFKGFIAGGFSGMLAGLAILFQKALVIHGNIFSLSHITENYLMILKNPYLYLWLGLTVVSFLVLQFSYHLGTSINIISFFNVNLIIVPVIGGIFIFKENLNIWQWISIFLIIAGVVLLSRKKKET